MEQAVIKEYRRLRSFFRASQALSYARTKALFDDLEQQGKVRLTIKPDCEIYDDSFIDTWTDQSEASREKFRKELHERIDNDGVWGVVGEYLDIDNHWVIVDSCWSFVGDDWKDSGYDYDIMAETADACRSYWDHPETRLHCAFEACRILVNAYKQGEVTESIEWMDVDDAHDMARRALP